MFNPANIRVVRQGVDAKTFDGFVGIRCGLDGKMEFCIPFGFKEFIVEDSVNTTKLFFALYKTLKQFESALPVDSTKRIARNIDGAHEANRGVSFLNKEETPVILYSKIASLEAILVNYDELRIFSIVNRLRQTSRIDFTQIGKYLHRAIYLEDNIPYVDEMTLPQPSVQYTITDIVEMYCYIYTEIKRQLDDDQYIPSEIRNHANIFREMNLHPDSSLFSPNHDFTIQLLRLSLNSIHRQVRIKDNDYWHFYTALENFLYGRQVTDHHGVYWGITSFWPVWEDMCLVYLKSKDWKGVWFADTARFSNRMIGGQKVFLDPNYETPFYFKLGNKKRYLRPDLVRVRPAIDADAWFENLFKIEWLNRSSCRISLKKTTATDLSWFNNGLDNNLQIPGMRQKRLSATSHTYTPITEQRVLSAISKVKERYTLTNTVGKSLHHLVVDFKYVDVDSYTQAELSEKIKGDIIKQLTYEYAIILNAPKSIAKSKSQFCVPYYFPSQSTNVIEPLEKRLLHSDLLEQEIEVVKVNYKSIEAVYLSS